jgi:hypothetical protein
MVDVDVVDVRVRYVFRHAGTIKLSSTGRTFRYSGLPREPGVYRIRVNRDDEQVHSYIGHSKNVDRRVREDARHHATPIRDALEAGGHVEVDLVESVHLSEDGREGGPVTLDREFARLMVEGVALGVDAADEGILNKARDRD